jgi:hypothetical protein
MVEWYWLIIAAWIGAAVGIFVLALCRISK